PAGAWSSLERALGRDSQRPCVDIGAGEESGHEAVGLVHQREQQVLRIHLGVAVTKRLGLRVVQRLLRLERQPVWIHLITSCLACVGGGPSPSRRSSSSIR